jgi:hypothetical protein
MGHDLPREVWPKLYEALAKHSERAAAAARASAGRQVLGR